MAQDTVLIGYYGLFFIPVAFLAFIIGFVSIPTAILSLLLIGIYVEAPHGPMISLYVLAWFFIIGYRIHLIITRRRESAP
jgi:hypothetical protein